MHCESFTNLVLRTVGASIAEFCVDCTCYFVRLYVLVLERSAMGAAARTELGGSGFLFGHTSTSIPTAVLTSLFNEEFHPNAYRLSYFIPLTGEIFSPKIY